LRPEPTQPAPAKPGAAEDRTSAPALPVGIPQFAVVKDQVTSGLKPFLDGLDWLQSKGYRVVLHVRQPAEEDDADRREVEKRGLRYLTLETSPQTFSASAVDQFKRIVSDSSNYPIFVYDKDGMLAGGLWYLYFRKVEGAGDEQARKKAAQLGLKEDPEGEHKAMWLAIQKYLSSSPNDRSSSTPVP
jgi:protein tyrosine phosphatase (PTP) superfamily phosphohydrolase (DUF442 family)